MTQLPENFEAAMNQKLGNEAKIFFDSLESPSPTSIRLNPRKRLTHVNNKPVPWASFGRYLERRPTFTLDPHLHAGDFYVQEASSMFLEQAIRQSIDTTISVNALDLCAAPGGKSTHILSLLSEDSLLVSNEVIRSRGSILSENIQKWGYPNCIATNSDPEHFQRLAGFFDLVVVDAPCSGEGLFRKDPSAMEEWSTENVQLCSSRQKRILSDVWPSLKTDGILIYCTCTYNEFENEQNLAWLSTEKNIEFMPLTVTKEWNIEEVKVGTAIGYRFYPHRVDGEGFFISVIRKKDPVIERRILSKNKLAQTSKKAIEKISSWINNPQQFKFFDHENVTRIFAAEKFSELELISQNLKIINAGTRVCEMKHDKAIPEHALALSTALNQDAFNIISVDLENAIRFLRKDNFQIDESTKGYCLISYEGSPLGFINNLGNRFNSLYPVEWRIRMQAGHDKNIE